MYKDPGPEALKRWDSRGNSFGGLRGGKGLAVRMLGEKRPVPQGPAASTSCCTSCGRGGRPRKVAIKEHLGKRVGGRGMAGPSYPETQHGEISPFR